MGSLGNALFKRLRRLGGQRPPLSGCPEISGAATTCLLALGIIALLAVSTHMVTDNILQRQEAMSRLVTLAAHQPQDCGDGACALLRRGTAQADQDPRLAALLATAPDRRDALLDAYAQDNEAALGRLRVALGVLLAVMLGTILAEILFIFHPLFQRLAALHRSLVKDAQTDALTGSLNRRTLLDAGAREFSRAQRYQEPLSVVMIDIDHFKRINDGYGHSVGDDAIRALARAVQATLRATDLFGRLGGEEFAVLLPCTPLDKAAQVAEKLRLAIGAAPLSAGHAGLSMTASLGVSAIGPGDEDIAAALRRADDALYQAKEGGRNRVVEAVPATYAVTFQTPSGRYRLTPPQPVLPAE